MRIVDPEKVARNPGYPSTIRMDGASTQVGKNLGESIAAQQKARHFLSNVESERTL